MTNPWAALEHGYRPDWLERVGGAIGLRPVRHRHTPPGVSVRQLAEWARISAAAVLREIKLGRIKAKKVEGGGPGGLCWVISSAEAERWLRCRRENPGGRPRGRKLGSPNKKIKNKVKSRKGTARCSRS